MPPKKLPVVPPAEVAKYVAYWSKTSADLTAKASAAAPAKAAATQLAAQKAFAAKLLQQASDKRFLALVAGRPDATSAAAGGGFMDVRRESPAASLSGESEPASCMFLVRCILRAMCPRQA